MPSSFVPRKESRKDQLPLAPMVMKATSDTRASKADAIRTVDGESLLASACIGSPRKQDMEENQAADNAHDRSHGDFVGRDHEPPDDIAGEHQAGAGDGDDRQRASEIVTHDEADDIG